jgi:hypothetical protein
MARKLNAAECSGDVSTARLHKPIFWGGNSFARDLLAEAIATW